MICIGCSRNSINKLHHKIQSFLHHLLRKFMTYHSVVRFSIKKENFAIVPSPVSILDIVQNQTCQAILTAHLHLGHAAFEVS